MSEHNKSVTGFRLITRLVGFPDVIKTKHYTGLPPQVTGGVDFRYPLNLAAVLLIEQRADGVFLFRFDRNGRIVGDTWHRSIEEAKEQAEFEFKISGWKQVPPEIEDVISFASER